MSSYNKMIQEGLEKYINDFKQLREENPKEAKRIAKRDLIRIGIIDENNNLKPPYNGVKVHPDDFERGAIKIKK